MDPRRPGAGKAGPDPRADRAKRGRPGDARLDDAAPAPGGPGPDSSGPGTADPRAGGGAAPDRAGGMEGEGETAAPGDRGAEP